MACTATVLYVAGNSVTFNVVEAATAAATLTYDVLAAYLAAGGAATSAFYTNLAVAHADQAAARLYFRTNCRLQMHRQVSATAGATYHSKMLVDQNIVGGVVAGNFRLTFTSVKAANGDTATWIAAFIFRHSIIR